LGFSLGYSRNIENALLRRIPYLDGLEWYLSTYYDQSKIIAEAEEVASQGVETAKEV